MPQDVVGIAAVGLGGWGQFVVRNFARAADCRLKYVCDAAAATIARQAPLYPDATPTGDYQQVLRDRAVDAVALATPAPLHFEMARAALLADKHVFVEKPMALRGDHAEELVDLAESRGLKLMVGHLLEYHPAVEFMKEQVASGNLGQIYYMYCQRLNLGVVRQHENAFWSLAPHDVSVILYLFDAEPMRVEASGQCFLQPDVEDVVFATLHFPDGRMASIHVSWLDPHKKRSMVLVGSEKMLVFDDMEAGEKVRLYDKGATIAIDAFASTRGGNGVRETAPPVNVRHGDILIPRIPNHEPLAVETQHFVNAIRNDTTPRSDGRDGLRVVRVLEAVDRELRASVAPFVRKAA